jgi:hypothetical protein
MWNLKQNQSHRSRWYNGHTRLGRERDKRMGRGWLTGIKMQRGRQVVLLHSTVAVVNHNALCVSKQLEDSFECFTPRNDKCLR